MNVKAKFLVIAVLAGFAGYFISEFNSGIQPNHRWVKIYNKSTCELNAASVIFQDHTVTVLSEQMSSSVYPYGSSEADIHIPVFASVGGKYRIKLQFEDCLERVGEPQEFKPGLIVEVWVEKGSISYGAR